MDRLSILLTLMTGAVIGGTFIVTAFTLGYFSVWAVVISVVATLLLSWPVSYLISRRIKSRDPNWDRKAEPRLVPDADAPEV